MIRDARIANPGTGFAAMRWATLLGEPADSDDEECLDREAREFLTVRAKRRRRPKSRSSSPCS
jgi:hypothetical protein